MRSIANAKVPHTQYAGSYTAAKKGLKSNDFKPFLYLSYLNVYVIGVSHHLNISSIVFQHYA
ncbi:MAG: hypothetical protein DBY14_05430 [Escherichia coli]|nr:MAG: hypothetical protein DBY14_05430 [Escherichia coli]